MKRGTEEMETCTRCASMSLSRKRYDWVIGLAGVLSITQIGSSIWAQTKASAPVGIAAASKQGDRSGARLAQNTCLQCHGTGVGPDLRLQELNYGLVQAVVRKGMNAMPAFRDTEISDGELEEVTKYLISLRVMPGQTPGPVPGSLPSQEKH